MLSKVNTRNIYNTKLYSMIPNDHEVIVNDTDVPGEGSDGGGHSAMRLLCGLTLGAQLGPKKGKCHVTRIGFGSPSERKMKLPRRKVHCLHGFQPPLNNTVSFYAHSIHIKS